MVLGQYIRCVSCGGVLADKQIPYEEGIKRIANDPKIINKEKARGKLLNELDIKNLCCRRSFIGYVNYYDIIL